MSTLLKRRTQADRSASARAALVEAATSTLVESGYAHATTVVLAQAAGMSTGALHHHFPTKESLFIAVLDQLTEEALELFRGLSEEGASGESLVRRHVSTLWSLYGSKRYWAVWEINMGFRTDPELHATLVKHRARTGSLMRESIKRNPNLGDGTKHALLSLMPFMLTTMRGIFLDTFFATDDSELNAQLDRLVKIFTNELAQSSKSIGDSDTPLSSPYVAPSLNSST